MKVTKIRKLRPPQTSSLRAGRRTERSLSPPSATARSSTLLSSGAREDIR
jgi:hypothetical protein